MVKIAHPLRNTQSIPSHINQSRKYYPTNMNFELQSITYYKYLKQPLHYITLINLTSFNLL